MAEGTHISCKSFWDVVCRVQDGASEWKLVHVKTCSWSRVKEEERRGREGEK